MQGNIEELLDFINSWAFIIYHTKSEEPRRIFSLIAVRRQRLLRLWKRLPEGKRVQVSPLPRQNETHLTDGQRKRSTKDKKFSDYERTPGPRYEQAPYEQPSGHYATADYQQPVGYQSSAGYEQSSGSQQTTGYQSSTQHSRQADRGAQEFTDAQTAHPVEYHSTEYGEGTGYYRDEQVSEILQI